jgi:hypothetical protein
MLQRVQVTSDQEQIRAALDWQEAAAGNVDTASSGEVPNGSTNGGLELDNRLTIVGDLGVGDDIEPLVVFQRAFAHPALDSLEIHP